MEPEAEKQLKAILLKSPGELTVHDKAFLQARWFYVGKNSRAKFAGVLKMKAEKTKVPSEEKPADPKDTEDETEETTDDTTEETEDFTNEQ